MSRIKANLPEEEQIIFHSFGHWMEFFPSIGLTVLALAAWYILPGILAGASPDDLLSVPSYERFGSASLKALGVIMTAGMLWFAVSWVRYKTSEFAVTNRRVLTRRGVILQRRASVSIAAVKNVRVRQNFMGRVLGFGTVTILATGGSREVIEMVPRPGRFVAVITNSP